MAPGHVSCGTSAMVVCKKNPSIIQRHPKWLQMKYFVFLALLPSIFASEIQNAVCIDGTHCPQGNYCCELPSGKPGCCEITQEWKDKGYVPALPPALPANKTPSMTQSKAKRDVCATQCGTYCFQGYGRVCCKNSRYSCPSNTQCCSNYYDQLPWCCASGYRCSSIRHICRNGAVTTSSSLATTSTTMMLILIAFMFGVVSKYLM